MLTQPYDKISPEMQQRYYDLSPDNLITIEKGKTFAGDSSSNNVHTRAAEKLRALISKGVLAHDAELSIYAYTQEYEVPGQSESKIRRGFIALGRLEDYEANIVFRHEQTLSAPKADRLELLRHTAAQTGLLFMLYGDAAKVIDVTLEKIGATTPLIEFADEFGVSHSLWKISDAAVIREFVRAMADKSLVIADGHHRYETALNYRDERRKSAGRVNVEAPYEFAMMAFFNTESSGLTILPTHRVIRNLVGFNWDHFRHRASEYFHWYEYPATKSQKEVLSQFQNDMSQSGDGHPLVVYSSAGLYRLTLHSGLDLAELLPDLRSGLRELDVVLLHRLLLEKCLGITASAITAEQNVVYVREMDKALECVDLGQAQLSFLLNPVSVQKMAELALRGEVLPQKSTDFYPKLLSGLVIYLLDDASPIAPKNN